MGIADIIPGVSGGTIAFISGIYEKFIGALSGVKLHHARDFVLLVFFFWDGRQRKESLDKLRQIDWPFLITLFLGIMAGVLSMARLVSFTLSNYPFYMYSLFFGLIFFSIPVLVQKISFQKSNLSVLLIFTLAMYTLIGPGEVEQGTGRTDFFSVFFSGVIAISAMILPGISGSYILVLLGQYVAILEALNRGDLMVIVAFGLGAAVGIFTFVRFVRFFLRQYYSLTVSALTGIMIGSLREIWPGNFIEPEALSFYLIIASLALVLAGGALIYGLNRASQIARS
jgi:putative membrane protein